MLTEPIAPPGCLTACPGSDEPGERVEGHAPGEDESRAIAGVGAATRPHVPSTAEFAKGAHSTEDKFRVWRP